MRGTNDKPISYVLLADGTSDRALLPIIAWTLRLLRKEGAFASPIFVPRNHAPVASKIEEIIRDYGPDLLFVHRDAESCSIEDRKKEIPYTDTTVPVVPVRMTEAWLLIDESAVRLAAGNPNGKGPLTMPPIHRLEKPADPKKTLHDLLRSASGYKKRRLVKFNEAKAVHRLSSLINDYSPLFQLGAYIDFHKHLESVLKHLA